MAYGEIYKHEYCDYFGNNSKISILKNGYSGSVKSVDAAPSPIVFDYEGDDSDKFDPVRPSTANITLVGNDTFNMEELYTADEREYMVEHFIGASLNWRGYIIPNGFSQDWASGSFYMNLVASDNLATLKDFSFLNDNGTVISGRLKHTDILLKCLNKLDINIELLTLTSLVREGGIANEDPLYINTTDAYTFLDTFVEEEGLDFYYENPDNAFDCYTVVQTICSLYGAKLYQNKGYWRFKRINVDYGTSVSGQSFNRYSTTGVKLGSLAYNENIVLPCNSTFERQQLDGGTIAMSDVYKSASVRYGYRYKQVGDDLPKIIKNQELDALSNSDPLLFLPYDWKISQYGGQTVRRINIQPELHPSGDFPPEAIGGTLRIWGDTRADSLSSNASVIPSMKEGDRAYMSLWNKSPKINLLGGYRPLLFGLKINFVGSNKRWELKPNSNTSWELPLEDRNKLSGNWVEIIKHPDGRSPDPRVFTIQSVSDASSTPTWQKIYITTAEVPEEGYITVEFSGVGLPDDIPNRPITGETGTRVPAYVYGADLNWTEGWLRLYSQEYKVGSLLIGRLIGSGASGRIYTAEQSKKYTKRPDVVDVLTADVENIDTIGNVLTLGNYVNEWNDSRFPFTGWRSLGALGAMDIMRQYKEVWRVIDEDIIVAGINIDTTFEFEERPGERYLIQRGSFDHKECRLTSATLIQVSQLPLTAFAGTETEEEDVRTESGGSSGGGSGGGSSGGGTNAPQGLQSVTDIDPNSTNIISVGGTENDRLITLPLNAPLPEEIKEDKVYIWFNELGGGGVDPDEGRYIRDMLDLTKPLVTGFMKYNEVTGMFYTDPAGGGGGGATEAWVTANFALKNHTHTIAQIIDLQAALNAKQDLFANRVILASITQTNINNWNAAFGWGNHNTAGYLKRGGADTYYQAVTAIEFTGSISALWKRSTLAEFGTNDTRGIYGTWYMDGQKNGYGGIFDAHSNINTGMHLAGGEGGSYDALRGGWIWFYNPVSNSVEIKNTYTDFLYFRKGITTNYSTLGSPLSEGAFFATGDFEYGLHVATNSFTGDTIFQSKRVNASKAAYDILFQNRGGGVGIGVDATSTYKFIVGRGVDTPLEGSVTVTNGSSTLLGTNTKFVNDFKRGQKIWIDGYLYYVAGVNSSVNITISNNPATLAPIAWNGASASNLSYYGEAITALSVTSAGDVNMRDLNVTENFSLPIQEEVINPEPGRVYLRIKPSNL